MTIRHLQIFKTVCDCGGITAAAERLNVTQPSVSLAMRELETFYGARLFDRMNRGVYPTEAGLLLRRYAEEILASFEEAASVLRGGRAVRRCRVGVNVSVAETYLTPLVARIRRDAPDVDLSVFVKNNAQLDEMLSENRIDFAIYDGASETGARVALPLAEECQVAVCAPVLFEREAIEPAELAKKPLLLREAGERPARLRGRGALPRRLPLPNRRREQQHAGAARAGARRTRLRHRSPPAGGKTHDGWPAEARPDSEPADHAALRPRLPYR